jgi:hypothetical protein
MSYQEPVILNAKGEKIVLNELERRVAEYCTAQIKNSLGFEIPITTLTTISKKISEQKFFEIAPAEYVPMKVGSGQWTSNIITYRSFDIGGPFESGYIDQGIDNDRLASADAGVDALTIQVKNWAKAVTWSIPELQLAATSGNWDLVVAKEKARKKNYDLGIQRIAFLGANGLNGTGGPVQGLFTQAGVPYNSSVITQAISGMSTTSLKTFVQTVAEAYRSSCQRTAWPTHFVIPESDYNGLASQASSDFPVISTLKLLEDAFKLICRNEGFKILPCAYGDKAYSGLSTQMYALYNYDEETIRMDVPVPYTNTVANSLNNFQFQNVAYSQHTGVLAYRPLELLYFGF